VGQQQGVIETDFEPSMNDREDNGTLTLCLTANATMCTGVSPLGMGDGNAGLPSSWSVSMTQNATPLPTALPLFATGLGALGLLGWRRKRKSRVSLLGEG
jgi:hypothetical protein